MKTRRFKGFTITGRDGDFQVTGSISFPYKGTYKQLQEVITLYYQQQADDKYRTIDKRRKK